MVFKPSGWILYLPLTQPASDCFQTIWVELSLSTVLFFFSSSSFCSFAFPYSLLAFLLTLHTFFSPAFACHLFLPFYSISFLSFGCSCFLSLSAIFSVSPKLAFFLCLFTSFPISSFVYFSTVRVSFFRKIFLSCPVSLFSFSKARAKTLNQLTSLLCWLDHTRTRLTKPNLKP